MWAAGLAGVAAGLAMDGLLRALRSAGAIRFDMALLMGTVFAPPGPHARLLGQLWHIMSALAFGVLYAMLFELLNVSAGWLSGAVLGLVHGLLSGLSLFTIPFRNRRVAVGEVADPGPFALNFGWPDAAALLGAHVLFGAAFGLLYPRLAAF
jgi:hypothetical protein